MKSPTRVVSDAIILVYKRSGLLKELARYLMSTMCAACM